jgi:hypothetical protein
MGRVYTKRRIACVPNNEALNGARSVLGGKGFPMCAPQFPPREYFTVPETALRPTPQPTPAGSTKLYLGAVLLEEATVRPRRHVNAPHSKR